MVSLDKKGQLLYPFFVYYCQLLGFVLSNFVSFLASHIPAVLLSPQCHPQILKQKRIQKARTRFLPLYSGGF